MSSREKKLALLNNILAAFAAAPKQAVRGANPATTDAWEAEVTASGVTVQIFYSRVSVVPWATEEYLVVSVPTAPELGGRGEIFRAEGVNGRWWKIQTSPLAWTLFGQQQQQPPICSTDRRGGGRSRAGQALNSQSLSHTLGGAYVLHRILNA